jgi:hypothetical protein
VGPPLSGNLAGWPENGILELSSQLSPDSFYDTHHAVGHQPIDFRQMPKRKVVVASRPLAGGGRYGEALGLGHLNRLIVLQTNDPFQVQRFDRTDERRLQVDGVSD